MRNGFTLIELLLSITLGIIVIGVGFMIANPFGQVAGARNTQRSLHLQSILNAVRQNMADHSGQTFSCAAGAVPTTTMKMAVGAGNYNIASCIVPTYIIVLPFDPSLTGAHYTSNSDYDTGYNIYQNSSTGQITVSAPGAELNKSISVMR